MPNSDTGRPLVFHNQTTHKKENYMTLTILFAFLGWMTFTFIVSGLIAFHRKLYDKASTTLFIAVLAMMTFSFIDFIGLLDGRFPDTPTWVKVCDIAECVFLSVLATIACYREHPKDKLQEAKNAVAAELGDYVRPYFHQMKRVIWKLRKQKAYDSVQICRNNRLQVIWPEIGDDGKAHLVKKVFK